MGTRAAFAQDFYGNLNLKKSVKGGEKEKKIPFGINPCKFKVKRMLLLQQSCEQELGVQRCAKGICPRKTRALSGHARQRARGSRRPKPAQGTRAGTTRRRQVLCPQKRCHPCRALHADTWEQPAAAGSTPKSHRRLESTEPLGAKSRSSEETLPGNSKKWLFCPCSNARVRRAAAATEPRLVSEWKGNDGHA